MLISTYHVKDDRGGTADHPVIPRPVVSRRMARQPLSAAHKSRSTRRGQGRRSAFCDQSAWRPSRTAWVASSITNSLTLQLRPGPRDRAAH